MEIGRISFAVEIDGEVCFVALPKDRIKMLISLAASLSDNGKLPIVKAPASYKFETIEEVI